MRDPTSYTHSLNQAPERVFQIPSIFPPDVTKFSGTGAKPKIPASAFRRDSCVIRPHTFTRSIRRLDLTEASRGGVRLRPLCVDRPSCSKYSAVYDVSKGTGPRPLEVGVRDRSGSPLDAAGFDRCAPPDGSGVRAGWHPNAVEAGRRYAIRHRRVGEGLPIREDFVRTRRSWSCTDLRRYVAISQCFAS